jgi:hypothetical protein
MSPCARPSARQACTPDLSLTHEIPVLGGKNAVLGERHGVHTRIKSPLLRKLICGVIVLVELSPFDMCYRASVF